MRVLTVNVGSSSIKLAVVADGRVEAEPGSLDDALGGAAPDALAHRVVHGGDRAAPAVVDDELVAELRALVELAPLHQPPALETIDRCRRHWPAVPNVACFDTAFHRTIPPVAATYALPARLRSTVRVYGFHGLSHAWAVQRVAAVAPEASRVIVAHLGSGQSLCAARDGASVHTTMGFTPLDGLVMSTRCGSLDPGAVLWLARHTGEDLDEVLEHGSGLLGLCGTGDFRLARTRAEAGDAEARFALEVWRHRLLTHVGSCIAVLGGLDALVFTGGIGEHDAEGRRAVAHDLAWIGVGVDDDGRHLDDIDDIAEITAGGAIVRTFVVRAREDLQLAAGAEAALAGPPPG